MPPRTDVKDELPEQPPLSSLKFISCRCCEAPRTEPSPLDGERPLRAWAGDGSGPDCKLCAELLVILKEAPEQAQRTKVRSQTWMSWLQALLALRLEGRPYHLNHVITFAALESKRRVLETIVNWPNRGRYSSMSSVQSFGSSARSETSASQVADDGGNMSIGDPFQTPTKNMHPDRPLGGTEDVFESALGASADPSSASAQAAPAADVAGARISEEEAGSPKPPSRLQAGGWDEKAQSLRVQASACPPMSLGLEFPFGKLGTSLNRIKGTINRYVEGMCQDDWLTSYKVATMKALARRLAHHRDSVRGALDIDLMTAYSEIDKRLSALMMTHQVLGKWCYSGLDIHLKTVYQICKPLKSYMAAMGKVFSPTMRIVYALAEFQHLFLSTKGIALAATSFDLKFLEQAFATRTQQPTAGMILEDQVKEDSGPPSIEPPLAATATTTTEGPNMRGPARTHHGFPLPEGADKLIVECIDKALQLSMYELPKETDELKEHLPVFILDLEVLSKWMLNLGATWKDKPLYQMIVSTIAVARSFGDTQAKPSDVRAARQAILLLASGADALRSSKGAMHYPAMKIIMSSAQQLAAIGLHDIAGDKMFDETTSRLEHELSSAFESVADFIQAGNDGLPQDLPSMNLLLESTEGIMTDWVQALGQWSLARLETRAEDVATGVSYVVLVLDSACWVAASEFMRSLPKLNDLGKPRMAPCVEMPAHMELSGDIHLDHDVQTGQLHELGPKEDDHMLGETFTGSEGETTPEFDLVEVVGVPIDLQTQNNYNDKHIQHIQKRGGRASRGEPGAFRRLHAFLARAGVPDAPLHRDVDLEVGRDDHRPLRRIGGELRRYRVDHEPSAGLDLCCLCLPQRHGQCEGTHRVGGPLRRACRDLP